MTRRRETGPAPAAFHPHGWFPSPKDVLVSSLLGLSLVSSGGGQQRNSCPISKDANGGLYQHGGSAQAYKPDAPITSVICEKRKASTYKPASWPFSRSSIKNPPRLDIKIHLWSCTPTEEEECSCQPLSDTGFIDVWQARSDGTYSSLRPGEEEGDCRARLPLPEDGLVEFETIAPGSTGSLNGLGPVQVVHQEQVQAAVVIGVHERSGTSGREAEVLLLGLRINLLDLLDLLLPRLRGELVVLFQILLPCVIQSTP